MIRITVSGQTFDIRQRLNDNKFRWVSKKKEWIKVVAEADLDSIIKDIRPMTPSSDEKIPRIFVELISVDINGKQIREGVLKIKLKDVARPGVSVLREFRKEVSDSHVSPMQQAPGPINPKKETRRIDDAFY